MDSILRESMIYEEVIAEQPIDPDPLVSKITSQLVAQPEQLMEQHQSEAIVHSVRSLFTAAVMTKRDPITGLLGRLMYELVAECAQLSLVVPDDVYLPAPPAYCPQQPDARHSDESLRRVRVSVIVKQLIVVFEACYLHTPLIKWYLKSLTDAHTVMKQTLGVCTCQLFHFIDNISFYY